MKSFKSFIIIVLLGVVAWFGFRTLVAEKKAKESENEAGIDGARIVNKKFVETADLKVYEFSGNAVGTAKFDGYFFHPTQTSNAPFTVDYFVNLQEVSGGSYHWNAAAKILTVDIPDVRVSRPNIDMTRVVVRQTGSVITREAGLAMSRQAAKRMTAKADNVAREPKNLKNARESARKHIARLAEQTLNAAGVKDATVAVSFPWEAKTVVNEQWDESRSAKEVIDGQ